MDEKNIKKYLKELMELESEKYKLEKIKHDIIRFEVNDLKEINKNEFVGYKNFEIQRNNELSRLVNIDSIIKPIEPKKPIYIKIDLEDLLIPLFILGIVITIFGFSFVDEGIGAFMIGLGVFIVFFSSFGLYTKFQNKKEYKAKCVEYEEDIKKYHIDMKKYEEQFKLTNDNYNIEAKKIDKEYEKEIKNKEKIYNKKCDERKMILTKTNELINNLEMNLEVINYKLNELYDLDIIFPKYRNFVAISTMYEYFASSRVEKLEGIDGAYNLYESEMRQNIIIVKLSDIAKNLEQIKQNQYCMYMELNKINESLSNIGELLDDIEQEIIINNDNLCDLKVINNGILNCQKHINKNINTIKEISVANFLLR